MAAHQENNRQAFIAEVGWKPDRRGILAFRSRQPDRRECLDHVVVTDEVSMKRPKWAGISIIPYTTAFTFPEVTLPKCQPPQ